MLLCIRGKLIYFVVYQFDEETYLRVYVLLFYLFFHSKKGKAEFIYTLFKNNIWQKQ